MTQNHPNPSEFNTMTAPERRAASALAGIVGLRMFGLFLILPVFALYAEDLGGVTPTLMGIALGIYGLTQAGLQIPFGMWSDRIGRKPVITIGLLIFALGSVVAALGNDIYVVIAGRALQGAGAIAAASMALAADLTREEHRTKAMAMIGASIGGAFALALVAGPALSNIVGVSGLFWITAGLAILAIVVLHTRVPDPASQSIHRDAEPVRGQFLRVLRNRALLQLDLGILILHIAIMAFFVAIPLVLRDHAGLDVAQHWRVYLPVLLLSVLVMVPFIIIAERRNLTRPIFLGAIAALALSQILFANWQSDVIGLFAIMVLFFAAFNLLEATLPALISRMAPADSKGTAMGMYSTAQFLGAFIGGASGGWIFGHYGYPAVFAFSASLTVVWLLISLPIKIPANLSSQLVKVGDISPQRATELAAELLLVAGVAEAIVIADDGVAYLKVHRGQLDIEALARYSVTNQ